MRLLVLFLVLNYFPCILNYFPCICTVHGQQNIKKMLWCVVTVCNLIGPTLCMSQHTLSSGYEIETSGISEAFVSVYQTTRRQIP
jgi:hypothetical protein